MEIAYVDVPEEFSGTVIQKLSERKGELQGMGGFRQLFACFFVLGHCHHPLICSFVHGCCLLIGFFLGCACPANNVLGIEEIPTNVQNTYSKFLMPYLIKIYHLL